MNWNSGVICFAVENEVQVFEGDMFSDFNAKTHAGINKVCNDLNL